MTLSLRKTSAALAAACVLLAGATACGSDKDTADNADNADTTTTAAKEAEETKTEETKTEETKTEETKADGTEGLAAGVTELPCVFFDDDLNSVPTQYKILWGDKGGFTVLGLEEMENTDNGMVVVSARDSYFNQKGPAVAVGVDGGELSALHTTDLATGVFQEVDFTWEGDYLHVDPPQSFVEGIPVSDVFAGLPGMGNGKNILVLCGENITLADFLAVRDGL